MKVPSKFHLFKNIWTNGSTPFQRKLQCGKENFHGLIHFSSFGKNESLENFISNCKLMIISVQLQKVFDPIMARYNLYRKFYCCVSLFSFTQQKSWPLNSGKVIKKEERGRHFQQGILSPGGMMMILKKIKLFLLPKTCFKNLLLIRYDLKINMF